MSTIIHASHTQSKARENPSIRCLVEGVGASSPVGEEHAESNSLHDAGKSTNSNSVDGALLSQDLGDDLVQLARKEVFKGKNLPKEQRWP